MHLSLFPSFCLQISPYDHSSSYSFILLQSSPYAYQLFWQHLSCPLLLLSIFFSSSLLPIPPADLCACLHIRPSIPSVHFPSTPHFFIYPTFLLPFLMLPPLLLASFLPTHNFSFLVFCPALLLANAPIAIFVFLASPLSVQHPFFLLHLCSFPPFVCPSSSQTILLFPLAVVGYFSSPVLLLPTYLSIHTSFCPPLFPAAPVYSSYHPILPFNSLLIPSTLPTFSTSGLLPFSPLHYLFTVFFRPSI